MKTSDRIRLQHMLDAAREAVLFSSNRSRSDLDDDRMPVHSFIRPIEIIGEAAGKVSIECRSEFPQIAWREIINMRNRLIHGYDDINLNIVWKTVIVYLPSLIGELEKILSSSL
jgi:uncharacterized protein with HEPN domain